MIALKYLFISLIPMLFILVIPFLKSQFVKNIKKYCNKNFTAIFLDRHYFINISSSFLIFTK